MGLDASVYRDDQHEHQIASVRIGNVGVVAHLFAVISRELPTATVLLNKVLYSGTHAGDRLTMEEVRQVERELDEASRALSGDGEVQVFVGKFRGIVDVALKNERPITF